MVVFTILYRWLASETISYCVFFLFFFNFVLFAKCVVYSVDQKVSS